MMRVNCSNSFVRGIVFRKANKADILQLRKLWLECFFEDSKALDAVFDEYFGHMSAYCACIEDRVAAALYLVHGSLNGCKAHYLCSAATLEAYRRQGIMTRLIEYALKDALKNGDVFSLLFPANEKLYAFYSRLGYAPECFARRVSLTRRELAGTGAANIKGLTAAFDGCINMQRLQKQSFSDNYFSYENRFFDFAVKYYQAYGVKAVKGKNCFAFVDGDKDCADVFYSAYEEFEEFKAALLQSTDAYRFRFTLKADNGDFCSSQKEICGMIKPLDKNFKPPENTYIGITLE